MLRQQAEYLELLLLSYQGTGEGFKVVGNHLLIFPCVRVQLKLEFAQIGQNVWILVVLIEGNVE